jgi:inhibitor of the pro-sigma K processing machinery
MDLSQKILVGLLAAFLLVALLRIFKAPLRLALKLLVNTLLGFLALYLTGLTAPWTGITLGLNLWNALIVGVLGLPGFVLLLLVQWIL